MNDRKRAWVRAAGLTLLPLLMIFPVIKAVHFEPAGPGRVWPVLVFAPIAMWIETRAIATVLSMYRDHRDPFLIAIVPLGLMSVGAYALSGLLLLAALPAIIHRII